jgi:hypothetical protein
MSGREHMVPLLFFALLFAIVAFATGCLVVIRLLIKHPIVGVPIAVYIGLDAWLGSNDAQALMCYAVIALVVWRLVHKRSFERLVARRLRKPGRRVPPRDPGPVGPGAAPPAVSPHHEDPISRITTVA